MSNERHVNGPGKRGEVEPQVKVVDHRRFNMEGEPVSGAEPSPPAESAGGGAEQLQAPDPRDATIAQQAGRIDELLRALAASVDEGRAARARIERQSARVLEAERSALAGVLLEAVDELERALAAAGGATGALVDGVRLTLSSLAKKVQDLGAERISLVGSRFDPVLAEAVDLVPVSDAAQDERVVEEVRPGYRIGEKVLRPARVRVGRFVQD